MSAKTEADNTTAANSGGGGVGSGTSSGGGASANGTATPARRLRTRNSTGNGTNSGSESVKKSNANDEPSTPVTPAGATGSHTHAPPGISPAVMERPMPSVPMNHASSSVSASKKYHNSCHMLGANVCACIRVPVSVVPRVRVSCLFVPV